MIGQLCLSGLQTHVHQNPAVDEEVLPLCMTLCHNGSDIFSGLSRLCAADPALKARQYGGTNSTEELVLMFSLDCLTQWKV